MSSAQIVSITAFAMPVSIEDKLGAAGKWDPDWVALLEAVKAESELVAPGFAEKKGLLFYENRYVPTNDKAIKPKVLSANHDSEIAGQFGQFKTLET